MRSSAIPLGGTSRFSMPSVVPSQETVQPRELHLARDGEAGDDVPAGAGRHDDEVACVMRGLRASTGDFGFGPRRCARFTSLRHVSLHRNRQLMRGLRA